MNRLWIHFFAIFSLTFVSTIQAQPPAAPPAKSVQQPAKQQTDQRQKPDMGNILIGGLKKVDGCLQVKTCRWEDGKQSIVAWFENKEAAENWYYSATHQAMMGGKVDDSLEKREPMQHIENVDQPMMVIATLTPAAKPELPGFKIPISQISIELFAALPGGAYVGGRVSPETFKVPHMRNYLGDDANAAGANGKPSDSKSR